MYEECRYANTHMHTHEYNVIFKLRVIILFTYWLFILFLCYFFSYCADLLLFCSLLN